MTDPKDGSAEELLELKRALYHGSSGPPTRGSLILSKKTVAFRGEALDCAWDLASVSAEPFAVYFADGATTRPGGDGSGAPSSARVSFFQSFL